MSVGVRNILADNVSANSSFHFSASPIHSKQRGLHVKPEFFDRQSESERESANSS